MARRRVRPASRRRLARAHVARAIVGEKMSDGTDQGDVDATDGPTPEAPVDSPVAPERSPEPSLSDDASSDDSVGEVADDVWPVWGGGTVLGVSNVRPADSAATPDEGSDAPEASEVSEGDAAPEGEGTDVVEPEAAVERDAAADAAAEPE
ncbi:MAG: hypothetical protein AAGC49_11065, partial [Brevundimonas sp.]